LDAKKNTALLGVAFLDFFGVGVRGEPVFLHILGDILQNQLLAVGILFLHNVLVVSLILLGMTFYVNLVILKFFKREKHADVIITHPRSLASVFACLIVFLSILLGATIINGGITLENLPLILLILLISAPVGIVEGYGVYLTIKKTLGRIMSMRGLSFIYGVFLVASIMEVGFINLIIPFAT